MATIAATHMGRQLPVRAAMTVKLEWHEEEERVTKMTFNGSG
jgi:hypothetical protein